MRGTQYRKCIEEVISSYIVFSYYIYSILYSIPYYKCSVLRGVQFFTFSTCNYSTHNFFRLQLFNAQLFPAATIQRTTFPAATIQRTTFSCCNYSTHNFFLLQLFNEQLFLLQLFNKQLFLLQLFNAQLFLLQLFNTNFFLLQIVNAQLFPAATIGPYFIFLTIISIITLGRKENLYGSGSSFDIFKHF
jgi:hypothetical protein